ncbi:MAG TPA: hypothetical protein VFB51_04760 [Solirubrobacterales bacterium]|nr:hypothetical protein [Solirubrobacterales bacterium]
MSSTAALRDLVSSEGEAIAPALGAAPGEDALGPLLVSARAGRPDAPEYALVIESVLEGYLLHFGRSRLLDTSDEDLQLLAGDYMYALGLSRLAAMGDLPAVAALADLITLSARHHAAGAADGLLLEGLWMLTALAVGGGPWTGYDAAIAGAREGAADPGELLAEVSRRAAAAGIELEAQHALIAFRHAASSAPQT